MIYRTSQRGTYRNINNNLDLLSYRISQLSAKIASEKSINKPSDNPSGAAAVLKTRTTLAEIAQNTANVNYSNTWLTNTGNLMSSIKGVLDEIYTKAEQGATDTYTAEQRSIIAAEIDSLFASVIQFADGKYGDNYLLSGLGVDVQPFSLTQKAQTVIDGCENSSLFTGSVENYGSREVKSRPDLPVQSQQFLIEVVQAGGIDSLGYALQSSLSVLKINGENSLGDYTIRIDSKAQDYNQTKVRLVAGRENDSITGTAGQANAISYSTTSSGPVTVIYQYGTSASPTSAVWDAATGTMTVTLQTASGETLKASSAVTAEAVASAVNQASLAAGAGLSAATFLGGGGQVDLEYGPGGQRYNTVISFNHKTEVEVFGDEITVYLERGLSPGDSIVATAADVVSAINADPEASKMVTATGAGSGLLGTAEIQAAFSTMTVTDPYTLARILAETPGTHNDIEFYVKNEPEAPIGEAGNAFSVVYQWAEPPTVTTPTTASYSASTQVITVTLGTSASAFLEEYGRLYATPSLETYHDAAESLRLARIKANTGTAESVVAAVEQLSSDLGLHIGAKNAEGDSGLGLVVPGGPFQFQEGYDQAALFRVSQDGGLTWGPPTAISPSEFQTGGLYYNSQLGHASLTTNLPGGENDLVFTANYLGTWGDDVRIEYRAPASPSTPASVTVGPQLWNICVNLATNAQGQIVTTAQEVMDMVNNHPEAGQLVTASLANYHEGGGGVVSVMDCSPLSTAEPYEVTGSTRITPLGYATKNVSFAYDTETAKCPNLIFQALEHGSAGNTIGVRYTMSADSSLYGDALYQDQVSISYETDELGRQVAVVHLATTTLPSCPDPQTELEAYNQFRELYPLYSCSTDRAVISTAGDVLEALVAKNLAEPDTALVWASMEFKDEGWDSTAKVGVTNGTQWLTGGDNGLNASDYGVALKFTPDGTALQVGDRYAVGVGWYNGDSGKLEIDSMPAYRTTTNVTGDNLLGANGASDNVLDTIQRLSWALKTNDTELVEAELPKLKAAIEKVTTLETQVGTSLIRNQFVLSTLELNKYSSETILSETEDADFTRLITDLKNSQTVYEAVLGTTGLTTKLSLLNYI